MRLITEDNRPELVELLQKLQEEAAEVTQAASKLIRFGLVGQSPYSDKTNIQQLAAELADLLAVIGLIVHESELPISYEDITDTEVIKAKIDKFRRYSVYWQDENVSNT